MDENTPITPNTNEGKEFYESKTFWANVLSILGIFIQSKTGYVIPPESQVALLALINSGLRLITHEAIK